MLYVLRYPFAFFTTKADFFYRKAWLFLRSEFSRRHLPRMMAAATQSQWKIVRFPSRAEFSRKKAAQFVRLPAARGSISRAAIVGWNSEKILAKHLSIQALAFLCIFTRVGTLIFQLGAAAESHAPRIAVKWLKAVYIIPSTDTSKEEIVKSCSSRRSQATSKTLRLARSASNSKHFSISYRLETRFLPAFCASPRIHNIFCVLRAVCCRNSGIVGFFSWTCAHHRHLRWVEIFERRILLEISLASEKIFARRDFQGSRKIHVQIFLLCWCWCRDSTLNIPIRLENSTGKHFSGSELCERKDFECVEARFEWIYFG